MEAINIVKRSVIRHNGLILRKCWTLGDLDYPMAWTNDEINSLVLRYRQAGRLVSVETVNISVFPVAGRE
jgi:hypothetical protein